MKPFALDVLNIPQPCGEDWSAMDGDAVRRNCDACSRTVHRIDRMAPAEQHALITRARTERVCVAFAAAATASAALLAAGCDASPDTPAATPQAIPATTATPAGPAVIQTQPTAITTGIERCGTPPRAGGPTATIDDAPAPPLDADTLPMVMGMIHIPLMDELSPPSTAPTTPPVPPAVDNDRLNGTG